LLLILYTIKLIFRTIMTESIPAILKKEYGCHRYNMSRTEECFAKQLESSVTTEHILHDLNNLEEKVPFKVYVGILISLFAAFGLWLMDVISDGYLTSQYYDEFMDINRTYLSQIIQECPFDRIGIGNFSHCDVRRNDCMIFDELQSSSHNSLTCSQKFYWTLIFVVLPLLLNFQEYLTLTDKYEITRTRKWLRKSFAELRENKCNSRTVPVLIRTLACLVISLIVVILWTPITAIYQWVCGSKYEIAIGRKKVDARKGKRRCDLTASRGELCEVNVESAFEPVVQGYIIFPYMVKLTRKVSKMISWGEGGNSIVFEAQCFTTMELSQIFAILSSIGSLACIGYDRKRV
jgi:hypothetical protein